MSQLLKLLQSFLPDVSVADLTPDVIVLLMAGGAAVFAVLAVWVTIVQRDPLGPRLKMLSERRAALKAGLMATRKRDTKSQKRSVGAMRRVVKRLNLLRSQQSEKSRNKLMQAGYRGSDAMVVYLFFKLAMPLFSGAVSVTVFYILQLYQLQPAVKLLLTMSSVVGGFYAPDIFIKNAIDKRKHALRKALPDALDLMVICAEAGLGMDAAFTRVSREMAGSSAEMADELALTAIELSFLPERRKALENLNDRTDMSEIRGVVNTLMQTEKYGTPLANSLRVLSAEFRNERLMKAEEKAARLPAVLTVPMVAFILPSLFVVLIGPAAIRVADALSNL
ncbi:MAG: type II secretion system F family protein [Alphaproteobacteria bacterium]|nr:type II secretion system F family protein [Alphaproteobacteria bacterium]